ncbi:MAG: 6-bladed beta-propeller [Gemmatimonadales bacterium]
MNRIAMDSTLRIALVAAVAGCGGANTPGLARSVTDTLPGGVIRVMNSGPTAWADTNGWKLLYVRTVQPASDAPGELISPWEIVLLNDGRLLVHDVNPTSIKVYDSTGRYLRSIGREGAGPGEYHAPEIAVVRDTLVIHDPQLTRLTVTTLDGKLVRSFPSVCCQFGLPISVDDSARIRVAANAPGGRGYQWIEFTMTGDRIDSMLPPIAEPPKVWEQRTATGSTTFYVPFAGQNQYLPLGDGMLLYGNTDRYTLLVTRRGTDTVRIFGRTGVTPIPVPSTLRDSMFNLIVNGNARARNVAKLSDVPHTYPSWISAAEDGDGNIWIERRTAADTLRTFDVFDSAGVLLGSVPAPFQRARLMSFAAGRVAVYDTDANDLPRIRIFRIDRRGH